MKKHLTNFNLQWIQISIGYKFKIPEDIVNSAATILVTKNYNNTTSYINIDHYILNLEHSHEFEIEKIKMGANLKF